ncbi:DUF192 domain-containing protein [Stappia sp. F7233]|uniref:DUF192 domain-containing protein n=2 Tax=Stappia albiluteola TaxID=2758565 RepID=A0A839AD68_9HYPH|nr:DUF192 domain-containing protein [Stappia albiluteola]
MAMWARPSMGEELPREVLVVEAANGARHEFTVEIADTPAARGTGLMFRKELAADAGMLFDFHREEPVYFWMKNTYVSLDMIFIASDGRIVRIAEHTTPLSEKVVPSREPARYVLEVVAGTSARLGLAAGDRVSGPAMAGRESKPSR